MPLPPNTWLIFLTITITLFMAAWFLRNSKSDVIRFGVIIAAILAAFAFIASIPSPSTLDQGGRRGHIDYKP